MEKETEAEIVFHALLISYALIMEQVTEKENLCLKVHKMVEKVVVLLVMEEEAASAPPSLHDHGEIFFECDEHVGCESPAS